MSGVYDKLRGTTEDLFQVGINGVNLQNISVDEIGARNADNTGYARVKIATPQDEEDAVNLAYLNTVISFAIVDRDADTSSSVPNNTAVAGYVVVTTPGSGCVIGDLLYDNGENDPAS